jgi:SHS family lactate transporter-like MFS transporter
VITETAAPADRNAAVLAGFLGWTLDAFDFFLVVYCLTAIGRDLNASDKQMALSITITLAFRPVGAFIFGLMADRYGRRLPLITNLIFYSLIEVLTAFAPDFRTFLILRALFGIGMGGEWGVGASLVMEKAPPKLRGLISGFLQQGYALGNLLAALAFRFLFTSWGWRPLFLLGGLPALLAIFVRLRVRESAVWEETRHSEWGQLGRAIVSHWKLFLFFVALMTFMNFSSHGTQDMYPTFLQRFWRLGPDMRSDISAIGASGAIIGGLVFGYMSDLRGRKRAMIVSLALAIAITPLWAYAPSVPLLILGAFLMQFMVQGAWGVIPAHLSELSPDSVRGFLPGFGYQCGVLISGSIVYIQAVFAERMSYSTAMALTAATVFAGALIVTALGREKRGQQFGGAKLA